MSARSLPPGVKHYVTGFLPQAEADSEGYVWNLAYGANMSSKTLSGRRKIVPQRSVAAKVADWQLTFDLNGLAYVEAAFGNIQPIKGAELHGVAHKIKIEDFWQLQKTEGGGGKYPGYYVVELRAELYTGEKVTVWALKAHDEKTQPFFIKGLPSLRYLTILRTGAREFNLDPDYIQYLDSLEHQRKNLLHMIFAPFFGALMALYFTIKLTLMKKGIEYPRLEMILNKYFVSGVQKASYYILWPFPRWLSDPNRNVDTSLKIYYPKGKK